MLQTALFSYIRKAKIRLSDNSIKEVANENFINPLQVVSAYWEWGEDGSKQLNVFINAVLVDQQSGGQVTKRITFNQSVGERFVNHMNEFLFGMINAAPSRVVPQHTDGPRRPRRPIETLEYEDVVTDENTAAPVWEAPL